MWLLQLSTRLIGKKGQHGSVLSKEEFTVMADIAHEEGVFQESESKVIKNLLRFDEVFAKDIMTPRAVMKIAQENTAVEDFFKENPKLRFFKDPYLWRKRGYYYWLCFERQCFRGNNRREWESPFVGYQEGYFSY